MMLTAFRLPDLADAVVEDEPAVPRANGRSAGSDFQPLPRRRWTRQPVVRREVFECIIDLVEVHSIRRNKLREAQSFPVKEIFRSGQGDSRPSRGKRGVTQAAEHK